jgi:hypothetical protein
LPSVTSRLRGLISTGVSEGLVISIKATCASYAADFTGLRR